MTKGIKRQIKIALSKVNREISGIGKQGGMFASALATEGYAGGYRQCLYDVTAALNGVAPSGWPRYWPEGPKISRRSEEPPVMCACTPEKYCKEHSGIKTPPHV